MRTLRALFWGSVAGAVLGFLFAPRRSDILRAEMAEMANGEQGQATGTGTTATRAASASAVTWKESAAYIGNSHTKAYHASTDPNLPEAENRVYFDTAADAEALGYHRAGSLSSAS